MTAKQLLDELLDAGCEPVVDGTALTFETDPPHHLAPSLEVLHTGVRAILTGKRWHAFDPDTGRACGPFPARGHGPLAFGALDPSRLLPVNVGYLCVESDPCWDRISVFSRMDAAGVFDDPSETATRTKSGGEVITSRSGRVTT